MRLRLMARVFDGIDTSIAARRTENSTLSNGKPCTGAIAYEVSVVPAFVTLGPLESYRLYQIDHFSPQLSAGPWGAARGRARMALQ